ncbi:MAG: hypothetical protein JRG67_06600, partial [Deltaproteobacteria bacterium]|nr:hypothetical protein [Deltaproteobacteria bacterium]
MKLSIFNVIWAAAVVIFVSACSKADEPADADGIDSGAGVVEASAPWKLD